MPSDDPAEPRAAGTEVELKFAVTPRELRRLGRHPLLAKVRPTRRDVASTYFDTHDLALHRRSLALRIRKEGRRYIQTLKSGAGATVANLARPEWQSPVARATPDLSQPGMHDQLGDVDGAALQPIFTSRVRRSQRVIRPDPATMIDVSYDQGTIETSNGATLPVCEIELELKE